MGKLKKRPSRSREKRKWELLGIEATVAASLLVVSIFVISALDRYFIGTDQYAAVVVATLLDLANADRAGESVSGLRINPALEKVAQAKANDMAAKSYFAHTSPEGRDPWYWFKQEGYSFAYAGENLAVDFSDSADVERAWMNSPTHRENILNPHFTEIGIAIAVGTYEGRTTTFVVQSFGAPAAAPQVITQESIPENPAQPALASAGTSNVLGESMPPPSPAPAPTKKAIVQAPSPSHLSATPAATPAAPAALVAHAIASPHTSLRYVYYTFGILVLIALAWVTRFEIRIHHRGKAVAAAFVIVLMGALMWVGDIAIFSEPVLADHASITDSA